MLAVEREREELGEARSPDDGVRYLAAHAGCQRFMETARLSHGARECGEENVDVEDRSVALLMITMLSSRVTRPEAHENSRVNLLPFQVRSSPGPIGPVPAELHHWHAGDSIRPRLEQPTSPSSSGPCSCHRIAPVSRPQLFRVCGLYSTASIVPRLSLLSSGPPQLPRHPKHPGSHFASPRE